MCYLSSPYHLPYSLALPLPVPMSSLTIISLALSLSLLFLFPRRLSLSHDHLSLTQSLSFLFLSPRLISPLTRSSLPHSLVILSLPVQTFSLPLRRSSLPHSLISYTLPIATFSLPLTRSSLSLYHCLFPRLLSLSHDHLSLTSSLSFLFLQPHLLSVSLPAI